jgi:ABC-type multidrug transport system fused ATPase/permease subunit
MATEILKGAAVLIVLILIFPPGVLVLSVLGLVYYQVVRYLSRKVSYNMGRERARVQAEEEVIAQELLAGIRQIMMFSTNRHWLDKFSRMNRAFVNIYAKDMVWVALPKQVMEFSAVIVLLSILFVSRLQSPDNLTNLLPELGIFAAGLVQLLPTITDLGRLRMEIAGLIPDAEGLQEALTERHSRVQEGSKPFPGLKEAIQFEQVDFAHRGRAPLLKGLNVTFQKNNVTALVGSSGSGKSTIVNLLLGLFEPHSGRILVDDVPLPEYGLESWRSAIGVVTQDPFLFHGTVAENILFGRKGFSMDDVVEAAHVANAHDFIAQLPEGYETIVGDRGMKLSGGQQQRVSIARAILRRPQILIFDEATSALDAGSERIIQETMTMLSNQRTVIQIAHRASTIARADKIVVLHEGQIVEEGRHVDLLKNDGEYARLFTHSH